MEDRSAIEYNFPIVILNSGKYIAQGGFWNGTIHLYSVGKGQDLIYWHHPQTVTCLTCDRGQNILISGSKSGDVIVWRNLGEQQLVNQTHLTHHYQMVTPHSSI